MKATSWNTDWCNLYFQRRARGHERRLPAGRRGLAAALPRQGAAALLLREGTPLHFSTPRLYCGIVAFQMFGVSKPVDVDENLTDLPELENEDSDRCSRLWGELEQTF